MINNHVSEYREVEVHCLDCHGEGRLRFEDKEELLDYCDNYQTKSTTENMIKEFEAKGDVACPECNGKGYIARLI